MKKNDKKYTIANAAGFIFPVTTVYMATYVIDSFQAKEYDLVVCTLFLVSCSVALTIVTGKSYTLTEQGIRHKFWGICYRVTPWSDVKDVMNVYVQTGARGDRPRWYLRPCAGTYTARMKADISPKHRGKSSIQNGYAEDYSRSVIRKSTRSGFWGLWRNIMARWTTILLPTIRKPTPSRRNGGRNEKPKERER